MGHVSSRLLLPAVEKLPTCYLLGEYGGGLGVFLLLLLMLWLCCGQGVSSCEAGISWALFVCVCRWCAAGLWVGWVTVCLETAVALSSCLETAVAWNSGRVGTGPSKHCPVAVPVVKANLTLPEAKLISMSLEACVKKLQKQGVL